MKEEYKKYLPIGSVVILKNGKKRLMITGYAQIDIVKKDKVYDYMGCLFPEGVISTENNMLFNHTDIQQIFCIGYQDEEQKEWNKKLQSLLTEDNIRIMLEKSKSQEMETLD